MNPRVKNAIANNDHTLTLEFTNGEVGTYDCKPILDFGVFTELRDLEYFKRVTVLHGTVSWEHEQDICPDTLYLDSRKELVEHDA
jgi:hypothetical protein